MLCYLETDRKVCSQGMIDRTRQVGRVKAYCRIIKHFGGDPIALDTYDLVRSQFARCGEPRARATANICDASR
ncbi:hypothetical protein GCM10007989_20230 [Devosia pacifica]|uniref:Uncharacterized protein n=1 Tax=Devosia pacifica TaxID=1335967 RepID=A0A918S4T9_9HYPH|nr:hypothetical protein GCM10007989_20230 [Devosia pacifica]